MWTTLWKVFPTYGIRLELFEGPLDLLLHLVRKQELDVLDLPVAQIARQFDEILTALELLDVDLAAEFLVTAATLTEIKSQQVLPRPAEEELPEETEDSNDDGLVARLIEYKRYKDASLLLAERAASWSERFERIPDDRSAIGREISRDRIKDLELWDLLSAFSRVIQTQLEETEERQKIRDVPVHELVKQVDARIRQEGEVSFFTLFADARQRPMIVGLFLAVLELVRHHNFRAAQTVLFGDILLRPPLSEDQRPEAFDDSSPALAPPSAVAADVSPSERNSLPVADASVNDAAAT